MTTPFNLTNREDPTVDTTNDAMTADTSPYPDDEPGARIDAGHGLQTLAEMTRSLRAEEAALRDAAALLAAATADHEAATRHARNFSDDARALFERDAAASLAATEQAVARAAADALDVARAVTRRLPPDRMTVAADVAADAAHLAAVLAPVVATAPLTRLRDDLRGALQANDRASVYVLASYLPTRLDADPDPLEPGRPEVGQARAEIAGLLAEARASLRDRSADPVRHLAGEVRAQAQAVARPAAARRQRAERDRQIATGKRVPWPQEPSLLRPA